MNFPLTTQCLKLHNRKHWCCKEITPDELPCYRWRNSRSPNYCSQGQHVKQLLLLVMVLTLQKPGPREGLGNTPSSSHKPGGYLRCFPIALGVNKSVGWCLLSCSRKGKNGTVPWLRSWSAATGKHKQRCEGEWNEIWGICGSMEGCWINSGRCS